MKGADNTKAEWDQERGAIEQEVSRDLSIPNFKFFDRMIAHMFPATPYERLPLGTKESFEATTNVMLQDFYKKWYTPSNAILVIVGDVEPAPTLARVKELFEPIPSHPLPERAPIVLQPVKADSFTIDSNLPYLVGFVAYRLPGTDSPDYAAAQILSDVLASQRANLYGMVPAGHALAAQFGFAESYHKASAGFGFVALPAGSDSTSAMNEMRSIISSYAEKGLPSDLVEAAKKSELAQAEFQRNSIPGLANVWSNALAAEGRNSPDDDIDAIRKVTAADVNRVARQYLLNVNTITAISETCTHRTAGSGCQSWRRRKTYIGSNEAGSFAGVGGEQARTTQGPAVVHHAGRHDAAERHPPDYHDRSHEPDDHGRGFGEAQ